MSGLFGLIVFLAVLGVVIWVVQTYLPIPPPFKIVIQVLVALIAIWVLLSAVGLVQGPFGRITLR